jgi:RimJ/RimL family protein N-acetyltransferase
VSDRPSIALRPPASPPSDGVVRLELLDERFVDDLDRLTTDPEVLRFTRVPDRRMRGFAATWVRAYLNGWSNGSRAGFAIVGEADGAFLGMAALVQIHLDMAEAEIGYIVAPEARGRGVAARAIALLSRWAFEDVGLMRLEAWIDLSNAPSLKAVERLGFALEGVRRSVHVKEDKRADMAVYSLLPGELRAPPVPRPTTAPAPPSMPPP